MGSVQGVRNSLEQTLNGEELDVKLLSEFDMQLSLQPELLDLSLELLPLFTQLATEDKLEGVPETLVPKILQNASFAYILTIIPPALFDAGLEEPTTAPVLVQMLQKVTREDEQGIELCNKAIQKLIDPEINYAGQLEKLVEILTVQKINFVLPDQELYESTDPKLQSRLMAINIILLRLKKTPRFIFWDLTSPDIMDDPLLMDIHIIYIGDLCSVGQDVNSQMQILCPIYMRDEPFLCNDIETIFLQLCQLQPHEFRIFDSRYGLVAKQSVTLLAKLPPSYLSEYKEMIQSFTLSSQTVPIFCNLATYPETFEMLGLSISRLNALPFDLRAQLIAASTINRDTARLFVGRFPTVMDAIIVHVQQPESYQWQQRIKLNLSKHGISLGEAPEVATAHGQ